MTSIALLIGIGILAMVIYLGFRKRTWNGAPCFFFEWNIRGRISAESEGFLVYVR